MQNKKMYSNVAILLLVVPTIFILWKIHQHNGVGGAIPRTIYSLEYEFDMSRLSQTNFVKAYLPTSNVRQTIHTTSGDKYQEVKRDNTGKKARWNVEQRPDTLISYSFEVETRAAKFHLSPDMAFVSSPSDSLRAYLSSTEYIQSQDEMILALAQTLKKENLYKTLQANYEEVYKIINSGTNVKTDALTTLRRGRASCNGKSRLFVSICRAQGIPARVAGGLILETVEKRTSHLWAEVWCGNQWVPFDVLNGHFAFLPANYLELFKGDNALMSHNSNIHFDYQFKIAKQHHLQEESQGQVATLWSLVNQTNIPLGLLRAILLLPLASLLVAIFKNVIGFKTFGVLLPALVGIALVKVDIVGGLISFGVVILIVSLLHKPLTKMGLLHTPKLVIMLTCVILTLLGVSVAGLELGWTSLFTALFLPVVIVSITAERFAKTLTEEQPMEAFKMLFHTFLVAFACYPIFASDFLLGLFLTHPELYLLIVGILIFLGRWIGFRVLEYQRFSALSKQLL